ncbi:outer membrane lipoprotein-sorting protein [Mangrovivirga sp. M17]|uniref:Outer membrane lipoprotein-sorting protein n=1 Tax=Mangrovivirga halotolerans TaxID=2993936 RepID=A0ABT3RVU6_9BACT|nr:outer membrane lipoprotein-sorting protein [Mangrovivirga halotolerans]MCX2745468.1 outer membrane lipoprotein-sorting protein [Mangrovivirga halotolerans]
MKWLQLLILAILIFLFPILIKGQDAKEIVKKADMKRRGDTGKATMTITIKRPTWKREMELKSWSHGTDYSLILVTAPARDKGTVFLKRDKEIWNWIPSIERNIKLPPSMMMQSWMGSDFTNDDLIKESSIVEDYEHSLVGDSVILGRQVYKIELIPKPNAPVVWGKIYSWIDKEDFMELKTELYDEDGYLVNKIIYSDIRELGGRLLPAKMEYIPVDKDGYKTIIEYESVAYDIPITTDFFSLQNMKRVK